MINAAPDLVDTKFLIDEGELYDLDFAGRHCSGGQ